MGFKLFFLGNFIELFLNFFYFLKTSSREDIKFSKISLIYTRMLTKVFTFIKFGSGYLED